jgi:hypothetical protein
MSQKEIHKNWKEKSKEKSVILLKERKMNTLTSHQYGILT